MKNDLTLKERLLKAGYPQEKMYHWGSDLYVFVNTITTKVIDEWCKENGFRKDWHCPVFRDQITGKLMYDCAFQYYE